MALCFGLVIKTVLITRQYLDYFCASTEASLSSFLFVFPEEKKMGKKKSEGTADLNWLKGDYLNHNIMGYRKKGLGSLRG